MVLLAPRVWASAPFIGPLMLMVSVLLPLLAAGVFSYLTFFLVVRKGLRHWLLTVSFSFAGLTAGLVLLGAGGLAIHDEGSMVLLFLDSPVCLALQLASPLAFGGLWYRRQPGRLSAKEGVKYGLICVDGKTGRKVLMDNHYPKGHHQHVGEIESPYAYRGLDQLIDDFRQLVNSEFGVEL